MADTKYTKDEIKAYIESINTDPKLTAQQKRDAINSAAATYKVSRTEIADALGITLAEVGRMLRTPEEIKTYYGQTLADPNLSAEGKAQKLQGAMKDYDVSNEDLAAALGLPYSKIESNLLTNKQIDDYIDNILNNPAYSQATKNNMIRDAATTYGVSPERITQATGGEYKLPPVTGGPGGVGAPGVDFVGASGLNPFYAQYVTDYLSRMSAYLGRYDDGKLERPQFGVNYGQDTAKTLSDIEEERKKRLGLTTGTPSTAVYNPYKYSFAGTQTPTGKARGGVTSLMPETFDNGGQVGGSYQSMYNPSTGETESVFTPAAPIKSLIDTMNTGATGNTALTTTPAATGATAATGNTALTTTPAATGATGATSQMTPQQYADTTYNSYQDAVKNFNYALNTFGPTSSQVQSATKNMIDSQKNATSAAEALSTFISNNNNINPYTGTSTVTGGTKTDTVTGGTKTDTVGGGTKIDTTYTAPKYDATGAVSQFTRPTTGYAHSTFDTQYKAPTIYSPGTISSTFTKPDTYSGNTISTDLFDAAQRDKYMSPFMSGVIDPQLREAERQNERVRQGLAAKFAQAGAFGGSARTIAEAGLGRDLATQLSDIYGKGQQSAFENAQQQFERDQQRKLEAAKATEQSKQFGANLGYLAEKTAAELGLDASKATELAKQEAGRQGLTSAADTARYGLEAQKLGESSKQFAANYGLDVARTEADYLQRAADLKQRAQEATDRGDYNAALLAQQGLNELNRAAEATRTFNYNQQRDLTLDPLREIAAASGLLSNLPAAAGGDSSSSAILNAILAMLGTNNALFPDTTKKTN